MKKIITKIICTILIIAVLSVSVGTKYFDVNHMEKVEAVGTILVSGGISAATIAEICAFLGAVAVSAYGIGEAYENREDIARFGKEFIDSCNDTVDGWVMQFVDASGQDYVFGSEALELIQNTEWSVIQGGLPPEGDPNKKDDKDKDKFHIPGDPMTHIAQFTALGATWFTTNAQNIYQDWCDILDGWVGKDTPIPQNNVLANNYPNSFTGFEKNAEGLYSVSGYTHINYKNGVHVYDRVYYDFQPISKKAVLYQENDFQYRVICKTNNATGYEDYNLTCTLRTNDSYYGSAYEISTYTKSYFGYYGTLNSWSFNINLPIYATKTEAVAALENDDFSGALNYGKDYRIADWLQQDWAGSLIDPLVNIGLTLSQMIELCRQLGLKTVQGLNANEMIELLKDALPKLNPELLPNATPTPIVVDPAVDPIYYPDPDAHPDKPPRPVVDPDTTIEPEPTPTPTPTPEPVPDVDPIDIPIPDVVPTVDSSFGDIAGSIRYKFPFSIPWDLHHLFTKMANTPKAPYFELPIVIERYGIDEKIIVDMKRFQKLSNMSRTLFSLIFVMGLIKLTMLVVGMRKEE